MGGTGAQTEGGAQPKVCFLHISYPEDLTSLFCVSFGRSMLGTLGQKYDQYLDFAQEDAHEFLRIILDAIRMEEQVKTRHPPPKKRRRTNPRRPTSSGLMLKLMSSKSS